MRTDSSQVMVYIDPEKCLESGIDIVQSKGNVLLTESRIPIENFKRVTDVYTRLVLYRAPTTPLPEGETPFCVRGWRELPACDYCLANEAAQYGTKAVFSQGVRFCLICYRGLNPQAIRDELSLVPEVDRIPLCWHRYNRHAEEIIQPESQKQRNKLRRISLELFQSQSADNIQHTATSAVQSLAQHWEGHISGGTTEKVLNNKRIAEKIRHCRKGGLYKGHLHRYDNEAEYRYNQETTGMPRLLFWEDGTRAETSDGESTQITGKTPPMEKSEKNKQKILDAKSNKGKGKNKGRR